MPKTTDNKFFQGTGRRKTSVAQVRVTPQGTGKVSINKGGIEYFATKALQDKVMSPLVMVSMDKTADLSVKVNGGGSIGQAEAIRHGVARALVEFDPEYRKQLKIEGYLMRDPREKERKKPGKRKARRSPQWSKR